MAVFDEDDYRSSLPPARIMTPPRSTRDAPSPSTSASPSSSNFLDVASVSPPPGRTYTSTRAARILAAEAQDLESAPAPSEPPSEILQLMLKMHQSLLDSADPQLLEIRVTTNFGNDRRFSFLRKGGMFREFWQGIRKGKGREVEEKKGLVMYGSDSDDETEPTTVPPVPTSPPPPPPPPSPPPPPDPTLPPHSATYPPEQKQIRMERAQEFAQKRRLLREAALAEEPEAGNS